MSGSAIRANIFAAACEAGFRDNRTGDPADERAVSWTLHETLNLCRGLILLWTGGGRQDRDYGLTPVGKATALEALRAWGTRAVNRRPNPGIEGGPPDGLVRNPRACCSRVGLGKTVQAVVALGRLWQIGDLSAALVVAPVACSPSGAGCFENGHPSSRLRRSVVRRPIGPGSGAARPTSTSRATRRCAATWPHIPLARSAGSGTSSSWTRRNGSRTVQRRRPSPASGSPPQSLGPHGHPPGERRRRSGLDLRIPCSVGSGPAGTPPLRRPCLAYPACRAPTATPQGRRPPGPPSQDQRGGRPRTRRRATHV